MDGNRQSNFPIYHILKLFSDVLHMAFSILLDLVSNFSFQPLYCTTVPTVGSQHRHTYRWCYTSSPYLPSPLIILSNSHVLLSPIHIHKYRPAFKTYFQSKFFHETSRFPSIRQNVSVLPPISTMLPLHSAHEISFIMYYSLVCTSSLLRLL